MIPRIYWAQPLYVGLRLEPDAEVRRYLLRTLRLSPGATVTLFNGQEEGEWRATLIHPAPLQIEVSAFVHRHSDSLLPITLVQGVAKADAMEWVVQKSVELGVQRIIPLVCRRSSSNAGGDLNANRMRRLRRIAVEATEQCGRVRLPEITDPASWAELAQIVFPGPRWLFWEGDATVPCWRTMTLGREPLTILVGPEGGLEQQEVQLARERLGFASYSLGPRILRTETAAIAAIALCQTLFGDMGRE
ncbi:MAG: 16S rRNA (uracil(1498)-N(3))-methyltransferase [Magnetococcus sp. MYC-9]